MVAQKATRAELRAIQQTQLLFRSCLSDLKNRGLIRLGTTKSYPRGFALHPSDAKLASLLYARFKKIGGSTGAAPE